MDSTSRRHVAPRHHPHRRRAARRAGIGLALAVAAVVPGQAAADPVAEAAVTLEEATRVRQAAETRLADLEAIHTELAASVAQMSEDSVSITAALADAHRLARTQAVNAYTLGGDADELASVLHASVPTDASVRTALLTAGSSRALDAADRYARMKDDNDPGLVALAERIDALDREIDAATRALDQATALESDAERALDRARDVRDLVVTTTTTITTTTAAAAPAAVDPGPRSATSFTSHDQWARLRECESGGNYRAISNSGRYRGAYQFDVRTWASVGGLGDPAAASAAEQDARALALFERRGSLAWPHCGRALRR